MQEAQKRPVKKEGKKIKRARWTLKGLKEQFVKEFG
jgi:hypothetical protein